MKTVFSSSPLSSLYPNKKQAQRLNKKKENTMTQLFPEIYVNKAGYTFSVVERHVKSDKHGNALHLIRFLNTQYETLVTQFHINAGSIKDYMEPDVYGVGYWGADPKTLTYSKREYALWNRLLARVYGGYKQNASYKDVIVCARWFCFKHFLEDIRTLNGYDKWCEQGSDYQLDKDELSKRLGFKVYSPQTCQFISAEKNLEMCAWDKITKKLLRKAVDIRSFS